MVKIEAAIEEDGTLRACKASGHAKAGKAGADTVCASISVLMRTALNILSRKNGITVRSGAPEEGHLWLETDYDADGKDFLFAVGVFLLEGLKSLEKEFPKNCKMSIDILRRT